MSKQHEAYGYEEKDEGPVETAEQKLAQTEEERVAAEKAELEGKERVRDKVARLVGELRGGRVFGAARKAVFNELEELVRGLKGEETVGDLEKERKAEEAKLEKKEAKKEEKEEKAGKW
jgi:hypothetical protein